MSNQSQKDFFIQQLLILGIFKKDDQHLFELTEEELEEEYKKLKE
ncbi:Fur-regulated basic protein FbpA [Pseudoneobacillus sp. C159]